MEVIDSSRPFELLCRKDFAFTTTTGRKMAFHPVVIEEKTMITNSMSSKMPDSFQLPIEQGSNSSLSGPSPTNSNVKKISKQPTKTRRRWKRPKDKPKRPLSAYNLYFKAERERIISGQVPDCARNLGFRAMAKYVAAKWNTLKSDERITYEESAMTEKTKYFNALAQWKRSKKEEEAKKSSGKSEDQTKSTSVFSAEKKSGSKAPAKHSKKKKNPLTERISTKAISDITEPLPIECHAGLTRDLGVFLSDALGCYSEESYPRCGNEMSRNQGSSDYSSSVSPVMKRVLATFDTLHADTEFVDFMSALDWR